MNRNFHLRFIGSPEYFGTAAEAAAERLEYLIIAKSHAICDDAINWDSIIEHAQAQLITALKA